MKTTIIHIEYLLSRNDCVIIPGLGAILATSVSAKYDPLTHTITPPTRSYTFNSEICHNDGLLISSVQREKSLNCQQADAIVSAGTAKIVAALDSGSYVAIGSAGTLSRDAESGAIIFTASDTSVSADALWFKPLRMRSVSSEQATIIDAPIRREPISAFRSWVRAAAIICLVLLGITISTPVSVDNAVMLASLAPQVSQIPQQELIPQNTPVDVSQIDDTVAITTLSDSDDTHANTSEDVVPEPEISPKYYVIVASLINDDEASLYLQMHPDCGLNVLRGNKHIRIYASVHDNVDDARVANNQASKTYPGSWVFKQ